MRGLASGRFAIRAGRRDFEPEDFGQLALDHGDRRCCSKGLSFALGAGRALALRPAATVAGKTSLLRAIAGLIAPAAGSVAFDGEAGAAAGRLPRRAQGGLHLLGHQDGLEIRPAGA